MKSKTQTEKIQLHMYRLAILRNRHKLQTIIAEGKAIVESLEASKRELQRRARERAVQIRRYQIAEEL